MKAGNPTREKALGATTLLELASASPRTPDVAYGRVLLQTGVSLSACIEDLRDRVRSGSPHASYPEPEWFEAIRLGEAAQELAQLFSEVGDPDGHVRALELRGRVITSTLGHCLHRVGRVMLELSAAHAARGRTEAANGLLMSLVEDSKWLVDELEAEQSPPDIEEVVALEQLRSALGGLGEGAPEALRARVDALLQR